MDPLSAIGAGASLIQLINTAAQVIKYMNEIKNAPKERIRLARELGSLYSVLVDLEGRLEECENEKENEWVGGLKSLAVAHGPMEQLDTALSHILRKLKPIVGSRFKQIGKTLAWPFTKKEIEQILSQIERHKSTINFALQGDQM